MFFWVFGSFLVKVEVFVGIRISIGFSIGIERCLSLVVIGERLWKVVGRFILVGRVVFFYCFGSGVVVSVGVVKVYWKLGKYL